MNCDVGSALAPLTGDPESIQTSAASWSAFSNSTSVAADAIRAMDSADFQGDEAELYRQKLNGDLPPHLQVASQAWATVATALRRYSIALEHLQARSRSLVAQAAEQQAVVGSAQRAVADADRADARQAASLRLVDQPVLADESLPAVEYHSGASAATADLVRLHAALQSTIDAAGRLRAEHTTAVEDCAAAINRAAGDRFTEPPGLWDRLSGSVGGWITSHADVLKSVSSVLRTVSGIAGLLAMIPVLSPIMGPIALATAAGGLLIDSTLKLATGDGSWTGIVVDAGLMVLPGTGKLLKGAILATKLGQAADRIASEAVDLVKASAAGRVLAAARNTKVGTVFAAPAKGLDWVNTKVADGLSHVPGANRLPAARVEATWNSADIKRAEDARDIAGWKPNGRPNRDHAAYVGAVTNDRHVIVGRAQCASPIHAEDDAFAQNPDIVMTKAFGWRRNLDTQQLEWTERPVCLQCQTHFSPNQFVPDVSAEPGGAWGR